VYLDTSWDRFNPAKHYSAVLPLQGRVVLDSDAFEQAAISRYYLRAAMADIVGPAAAASGGFQISWAQEGSTSDLAVAPGRIYVGGILAEAAQGVTYLTQPDGYLDPSVPADRLPAAGPYVVYLRVWERSVTAIQDQDIREVALGIHGPDTAGRAQVVWQVVYWQPSDSEGQGGDDPQGALQGWQRWQAGLGASAGTLKARAKQPADAETDICSVSPQAQYRGRENQNYRVEIFRAGTAQPGTVQSGTVQSGTVQSGTVQSGTVQSGTVQSGGSQPADQVAQYVWSRDAGSTAFPVESLAGSEVTVSTLGRDLVSSLEIEDWVEIADDASASRVADERPPAHPRTLFQVTAIDAVNRVVTLSADPTASIGTTGTDPTLHPLLRRWDSAGMTAVTEGQWLNLESGVQVLFAGLKPDVPQDEGPASYRSGDYWLIPARTVLADVIWSQDDSGPRALPPLGVAYHYAPLAFVPDSGAPRDLRSTFNPIALPPTFA
jgi:hypothetical protein